MSEALFSEARGYICNGLAAYVEAFELDNEIEINEEFFEGITDALRAIESMMPMFKTLWEINKKLDPDQTFVEFLREIIERRG